MPADYGKTSATTYFLYQMQEDAKLGELEEGLYALVWAYYQNNTDATEVEPQMLGALTQVLRFVEMEDRVNEIVQEAERRINDAGGITSDTDSTVHEVRTASAWAEE